MNGVVDDAGNSPGRKRANLHSSMTKSEWRCTKADREFPLNISLFSSSLTSCSSCSSFLLSLSLLFPTFHIEFHQSNKDVGGIFFLEDLSRTEQLKDHFPSAQNCGEHIQSINYVDEWKVQANSLFLSTYVGFFFFSLFFFFYFFYLSVSCSFYVFIFVVVHRVRGETLVALKALVDLKRTMQRFISAWVPFDCIRSQFESFDFRSKDSGP